MIQCCVGITFTDPGAYSPWLLVQLNEELSPGRFQPQRPRGFSGPAGFPGSSPSPWYRLLRPLDDTYDDGSEYGGPEVLQGPSLNPRSTQ